MDHLKNISQSQAALMVGLVTLVNVILTASLTHWLSGIRARSRYRWDEKRMEAYAEYARSVKKMALLAVRIAKHRGMQYETYGLCPEEGIPLLMSAEEERAGHFEHVLLLGDSETIAAARVWQQTVWHRTEFAQGHCSDPKIWEQSIVEYDKARDGFYRCARKDLRIGRGSIPSVNWPPAWMQNRTTSRDVRKAQHEESIATNQ